MKADGSLETSVTMYATHWRHKLGNHNEEVTYY